MKLHSESDAPTPDPVERNEVVQVFRFLSQADVHVVGAGMAFGVMNDAGERTALVSAVLREDVRGQVEHEAAALLTAFLRTREYADRERVPYGVVRCELNGRVAFLIGPLVEHFDAERPNGTG